MASQVSPWLSPNYLHPDRSHEPSIEIELFSRSSPAKTQRLEPGLFFLILNRNDGIASAHAMIMGSADRHLHQLLPDVRKARMSKRINLTVACTITTGRRQPNDLSFSRLATNQAPPSLNLIRSYRTYRPIHDFLRGIAR